MSRFFADARPADASRPRVPRASPTNDHDACAGPTLKPAADARLVAGEPLAGASESAGVRVVVWAEAWQGRPEDLERKLTPLRVTIENTSDQPLRVRCEEFKLDSDRGVSQSPLPPLRIEGTVTETADRPVYVPRYAKVPRFTHRGFYVAPCYAPYYSGLRPWGYPLPYDSFYFDTYYPRWQIEPPTAEMIEMAIPEGVIEPGGQISGFLYFPEIAPELGRVTFKSELMRGQNGKRLGALEVPFQLG